MGLAWGVVVVLAYGATAQAAPNAAATPTGGSAGAAAIAPSSSAATPAPSVAPVPVPSVDGEVPAVPAVAPEAASPPPEAAVPEPNVALEEDEPSDEEARPRKKRKKHRPLRIDDEDENEAMPPRRSDYLPAPEGPGPWHMVGRHVMLGVERVTSLLGWSFTETVTVTSSSNGTFNSTSSVEVETSGTDVSFLGAGSGRNVFGVPRLALDGMFSNGFTLGGSISYLVTSSKGEVATSSTQKRTDDQGSVSTFVFAPRIGVVIPASPTVGVWLRGGISRISSSREVPVYASSTGGPTSTLATETVTLVDVTLDPQLVISPVPHVGLTLGAVLDIGATGTYERSGFSTQSNGTTDAHDVKASSYGVTAGLVAIF